MEFGFVLANKYIEGYSVMLRLKSLLLKKRRIGGILSALKVNILTVANLWVSQTISEQIQKNFCFSKTTICLFWNDPLNLHKTQ